MGKTVFFFVFQINIGKPIFNKTRFTVFISRWQKQHGKMEIKKQKQKLCYHPIRIFLVNGKIQSWNGLPIPMCHLTTESVQGKAGFPIARSLGHTYIEIFNAWMYLIPTCLDTLINKRRSNHAVPDRTCALHKKVLPTSIRKVYWLFMSPR